MRWSETSGGLARDLCWTVKLFGGPYGVVLQIKRANATTLHVWEYRIPFTHCMLQFQLET